MTHQFTDTCFVTNDVLRLRAFYETVFGSKAEGELQKLSLINEAILINATSEDLINQLRNLFNIQM